MITVIFLRLRSYLKKTLPELQATHLKNTSSQAPAKGIFYALIATALFAIVGVLVRLLSTRIGIFQILLFRQAIFITLMLPSAIAASRTLFRPQKIHLHATRVMGAFLALSLNFLVLGNMPLADATALSFTQVLFVAVISSTFLAERISAIRLLTIITGFCGVILVVRPTFENASLLYTFAGLGGALGASIAVTSARRLALTESKVSLLVYQAFFVGVMALLPCIMTWQSPTPNELVLLVLVGVISSLAQWFGVTAFTLTEANVVSNVEYSRIIYSMIAGYLVFAERPDHLAIAGAFIILASPFLQHVFKNGIYKTSCSVK